MAEQNKTNAVSEAERRIEEARRTRAQRLDLSSLGLTELPQSLGQLAHLELLIVWGNQLTALPESLGQLAQLQTLDVSKNKLRALPESLGQLAHLELLIVWGNQLTALPESLGQLAQLRTLDASNNQLRALPESLGQLAHLELLIVWGNQLTALPESLGQLAQLQRLDASNNQLRALPESLGQLAHLELLIVWRNQLRALPESLPKLRSLKVILLHGNDVLGIPPELLGPQWYEVEKGAPPANPTKILEYYIQLRKGRRKLNEARLILVGRGGAGKTSLVNRLVHDTFDPDSAKTEGIQITQWTVTVDGEAVRLHVWDFGGQEIMHATHQFFLTERSFYFVVLSGREGGEDADAEYWLKLVASFGGGSPVFVVLNKMVQHPFDVNRGALQQKYPNIREFVATDCEDGRGLDVLNRRLLGVLSGWDARRVAFPASWFAIKERLAGMSENYLSFDRFRQVCWELGETDRAEQESLAGYLHTLGIALNYKDDPRLRDANVLNPRWVTGGIYRILTAPLLADRKGVLHADDLPRILAADEYPRSMHLFLLDLMRKFELNFPFPDDAYRYLVPDLLDKQQPREAVQFSPDDCLGFEYHYPILPEGLLPRFIVRTHSMSEGQPRSRTGVILEFEGCRALVKADVQDKRVQVLISGPAGNRRRLLAVIRSDFERIHASIRELKPQEMVPVPGHPQLVVPYKKLTVLEQQGHRTLVEVFGDEVLELDVAELLNGVDLAGSRRRPGEKVGADAPLLLFYIYAHEDEQLRNQLETHLKILERRSLIASWHDRLIGPGHDWAKEIDENLDRTDLILLLVSADFIASDYWYAKEMKRALERHADGKAAVIPIIVRPVNWNDAWFARLQALPEDGKAVTLWPDRDAAWHNVSEGIEREVRARRKSR